MAREPAWLLASALGLGLALVVSAPLIAWLAREKGPGLALAAIPLRAFYYTANVVSVTVGTARWLATRRPGGEVLPNAGGG